ncbi:MAG: DUF423 domain-containing protein [Bacteroidia bacterium]
MTNYTLQKQMIQTGAVLCGLAVALGAFGAHELKDRLNEHDLDTYKTAVNYQFLHALAILVIGISLRRLYEKSVKQIYYAFLAGIGVFSGSLYLLATRSLTLGDGLLWIGGITPIGGVAFLAGWGILAYKGYKRGDSDENRHHRHLHKNKESNPEAELSDKTDS